MTPIYDAVCRDLGHDPLRPELNPQSQRAVRRAVCRSRRRALLRRIGGRR